MQSFPKYRILLIGFFLFALSAFFVGCSSEEPESEPVRKEQIGVVVANGQDENMQVIEKNLTGRLKRDGVRLIWLDSAGDETKQKENIAKLIERKVDVVVFQPLEGEAAGGLARQLKQEQIKVITLGKMPVDTPLDGHIGPDLSSAGHLQGQYVLDTLARGHTAPIGQDSSGSQESDDEGSLVQAEEILLSPSLLLLKGSPSDPMVGEVSDTILSLLQNSPDLSVRVREIPPGNSNSINSKTEEFLTETDQLPGFVVSTDTAVGEAVLKFLQDKGLENKVITVGLGGGKSTAQALAARTHNAEVDIMPEVMAGQLGDAAMALVKGEHWPYDELLSNGDFQVPLRLTPVRLIKPDNAYLLEERWGDLKEGKSAAGGESDSGGKDSGQDDAKAQEQKMKTTVKIKTMEGKTYEMEIEGQVQSIESSQKAKVGAEGEDSGKGGQGKSDGGQTSTGGEGSG